jgi:uncharacterized protein YndB with AHSA1/START domain
MKVIKLAAVFLGFVILALLAIVAFAPKKIDYDTETRINASIEDVWEALHDSSMMDEWFPGYSASRIIQGDGKSVGSIIEFTLQSEGGESIITEEFTKFIPNKQFSFKSVIEGQLILETDVYLTANDSVNTLLTSENTATALSKSMRLYMYNSDGFEQVASASYDKLKKAIER